MNWKKQITVVAVFMCLLTMVSATEILRPDGDGVKEWNKQGSCSDHADCVNEVTPTTGTRVQSSTQGSDELFSFSDIVANTSTVDSVTLYYYAERWGSNKNEFVPLMRISGNYYEGNVIQTSNNYNWHSQKFTNNPHTGSAWLPGELDDLEAGMRLESNSDAGAKVATVYIEVDN